MRTALRLAITSIIAFLVGIVVGVGGMIYLQDFFAGTIRVTGVVMYESNPDSSASGLPPRGYYVESSATGRVYIEHSTAGSYLGQQIHATGRLGTLCGPGGFNCYPVVWPESIVQKPQ